MIRRWGPVVSTAAVLAGAIAVLILLGRGDLASPPLTSPGGLRAWFDQREPAVAVFAILRLAALAVAWYLLVLLGVGVLATATRSPSAAGVARTVEAVAPPGMRRAAAALLGLGLVGAAAGSMSDERATESTETMVLVERPDDAGAPRGPTERLVPIDEEAGAAPDEATLSLLPAVKHRQLPVDIRAGPALETWIVQPGDHFWSIAESQMAELLGRPPSDEETTPYWRRLVEHNRSRLSDPGQPDLLFVGQTVELPPPAEAGA